MAIMSISGFSLLCTTAVICLHNKDPPTSMPRWLEIFIFCYLARVVCKKTKTEDEDDAVPIHETTSRKQKYRLDNTKVTVHSSVMTRVHDVSTSTTDDIVWQSRPRAKKIYNNSANNQKNPTTMTNLQNLIQNPKITSIRLNNLAPSYNEVDMREPTKLDEILAELKKITKKLDEDEINDSILSQWKDAAFILDRFFLIAFWLLELFIVVLLFFIIPYA